MLRFICVIVFDICTGFVVDVGWIATAAKSVGAAVAAVIVVDQSSPTVIWSMDRYNEHTDMPGKRRRCAFLTVAICTEPEMVYMCYLF